MFILNLYLKDEVFYESDTYDLDKIIKKIVNFSSIFTIDYSVKSDVYPVRHGFFDSKSFFEIALPMSVYKIEYDIEYKTDSDKGADFVQSFTKSVVIMNENGTTSPAYPDFEEKNNITICKVLARINKE